MTTMATDRTTSTQRHPCGGRLVADAVSLGYGDRTVVHGLSLAVPDGAVTAVVGANACGKSTLLRGMARLVRPTAGSVLLDGGQIHRASTRQVARTLGLLPQAPVTPEGVSVVDLVSRGRHPHTGALRRWGHDDDAAVAEALALTGTTDLAERPVDELSGGQRQRVWVAMALAQQTDLLLLDEPTTYLDVAHQMELLELLRDLNATRGTTIVMVLHELNLAARFADHLVAMSEGRIVATGTPGEVLTEETVRKVFGLSCRVIPDPVSGTPLVVPVGSPRGRGPPMTQTAHRVPMILAEVEVTSVERLSPSFVRVELGSPELADFGVDGPLWDQRIKLVFPGESGRLPSFAGADESWYAAWLDLPEDERGHMRTYTVRDVVGSGHDTRLVVDLVLHLDDGASGPGSRWAAAARPGDRLVVVAPRRGEPFGGIEFVPGTAQRLLLVADETAVPAVAAIVEQLPAAARGTAFLEVPVAGDVLDLDAPVGIEVVWLPRDGAPLGERLHAAVVAHLGAPVRTATVPEEEVEPHVWETPTYSSSGEQVADGVPTHADLYAWIAGESGVVTGLRRHLVRGLGIARRQVAFMGYWRRGIAMRS